MRGGYVQQARIVPARGYDLGIGAYYEIDDDLVIVEDPRG
jgi:hypothetical protein